MRYLKLFGLAAVAATALMACAGAASATVLTSPTGTVYTGKVTIEPHTVIELHGSFTTVKCNDAHLEFNVERHGVGVTVGGNTTTHTFYECNFPVTVLKAGSIEIHAVNCNPNNECTGTITSTGTEMQVETSIGTCIFTTSNTHIGTLTPTNDTEGHATIDTNSTKLPRTGGSIFCGSAGTLTGAHTVTTPSTLWVNS